MFKSNPRNGKRYFLLGCYLLYFVFVLCCVTLCRIGKSSFDPSLSTLMISSAKTVFTTDNSPSQVYPHQTIRLNDQILLPGSNHLLFLCLLITFFYFTKKQSEKKATTPSLGILRYAMTNNACTTNVIPCR